MRSRTVYTHYIASGVLLLSAAAPASAQNFNVDLGSVNGTPPSSYAGAGTAGSWNTLGLGVAGLLDTGGAATGVSVDVSSDGDTGTGGGIGDDITLIGDNILDCGTDQWSLAFSGLQDGSYRVILYAPSNGNVYTGDMLVNGAPVAALPGTNLALTEGVSYAVVVANVSGGALDLSGAGDGSFNCAGLAGVQIEGPAPPFVPALSKGGLALLALLVAVGSGRVLRRK
jgi:hypothetical protein